MQQSTGGKKPQGSPPRVCSLSRGVITVRTTPLPRALVQRALGWGSQGHLQSLTYLSVLISPQALGARP